MKCEKCGQDFPSDYYFETNTICKSCFENLSPEEKTESYKSNQTKNAKEEAKPQIVNGFSLECPICKHDKFWKRKTIMNTPAVTFFGVEWANKEALNYVCNRCGYIYWFFNDKPE